MPEAEESTSEDVKSPGEQCSPTMQGRRRAARPAQRMMAGAAPRTAHFSPPRSELLSDFDFLSLSIDGAALLRYDRE